MPIADEMEVTRVLFAETRDLTDDPALPGGLKAIREAMAALIRESDKGLGFAPPATPTIDDLANPALLAAWQDCATVAKSAPATPQVNGKPANVAILAGGDPLKDTTLTDANPWLGKAPPPQEIGRARRGAQDIALFATIAPTEAKPGRYPRSKEKPVVEAGTLARISGFPNRFIGAAVFILVLAIMIAPAIFAGKEAYLPDGKRAAIADLRDKAISRQNALDVVLEANKTPTQATTDAVEAAQKDLADALDALVKADGAYGNLMWQWIVATLGLFLLLVTISWGLKREILGFLVDERGRMSLARFQFVAWVLTILGAYWVAAAWNVGTGYGEPGAEVPLPQMSMDLWILLGITVTSPLVSALILNVKAGGQETTVAGGDGTTSAGSQMPPQAPRDAVGERGVVDVRTEPWTSSFLDMFTGEEVANRASVDISRVQQFVFTLVALLAYLGLLATMFLKVTPYMPIRAMPEISIYVVGLLAVSHAAYLAAKSLPK